MKFCEQLGKYIEQLSCTAKELCKLSGISPSTFSRYRSGERIPEIDTVAFDGLCNALEAVAREKGYGDMTRENIKRAFLDCEDIIPADRESMRQNFNTLISALDINIKRLCKEINYDVSTVFRIRNGTRKPADPERFVAAIAGFHSEGRYYLTKSKKEFGYYRKRANDLLSNACPLMEIYRSDREKDFSDFLTADSHRRGRRRSILSALPVYTMDNDLLNNILDRNGIDDRRGRDIKAYVSERKKRVESILETMTIEDEICCLSREEFETRPHALDLSGVFCASDVLYSYDDYSAHLKSTERYAQIHENYSLKYAKRQTFCNLQILIHEGQWAMISKGNAPAIHFVIRHPKLLSALENFIPPVIEDQ